jgi:hypothetical protein
MRSSYEVADELDFVPMDRFQKEFFLLRADEWETYRAETDSKQGDLSDALYFDFISAAQYATITNLMTDSPSEMFEERINAEGATQLVQRDPTVRNAMLPSLFIERVGDRILDALLANFTGPNFFTQPPPPCPPGADSARVAAGVRQLYAVLAENGYAREIAVSDGGSVDARDTVQARPRRKPAPPPRPAVCREILHVAPPPAAARQERRAADCRRADRCDTRTWPTPRLAVRRAAPGPITDRPSGSEYHPTAPSA